MPRIAALALLLSGCGDPRALFDTVSREKGRPTRPPDTGSWTLSSPWDTGPFGTGTGTGTGTSTGTSSQAGCLRFGAYGDLVIADDAAMPLGTGAFTVEARLWLDAATGYVVSWGTSGNRVLVVGFEDAFGDGPRPYAYGGSLANTVYGDPVVGLGTWTHLVFARDAGGNCTFWVDGAPAGGGPMTSLDLASGGRLWVGDGVAGTRRPFTGVLDDLRVWDSFQDGATLFGDGTVGPAPAGLVLWYPFSGTGAGAGLPVPNRGTGVALDGETWGTGGPQFVDCPP